MYGTMDQIEITRDGREYMVSVAYDWEEQENSGPIITILKVIFCNWNILDLLNLDEVEGIVSQIYKNGGC